ncbi:Os04g0389175 [Oryza sativa Japonica Group]|uniref:Os04g0389175 protein n=1 Tax=Oryza sativa subsp. japonica TaxID=39947 RepID=A0A0P0W9G9_ORYSJ|nr:Os04g0389175 [Oryza sativa Japonica Group]
MATSGTESRWASASADTRLVAPGPEVATQTPGRPDERAYPDSREGLPLLVAEQVVADGRRPRQRLVDLHRRAARVPEHVADAAPPQRLHEDVRALPPLRRPPPPL